MKNFVLISMFVLFSVGSLASEKEESQGWSSWALWGGAKIAATVTAYEGLLLVSPRVAKFRETRVMPLMSGLMILAMSSGLGHKLVELGIAAVPATATTKVD